MVYLLWFIGLSEGISTANYSLYTDTLIVYCVDRLTDKQFNCVFRASK